MKPGTESEFVWGAEAIGALIGKTEREAHYALTKGLIPARREGRQWVASREAIRQHLATPNNGCEPRGQAA